MHIISIDIGAYKTRMYSSKSGGTMISDKLGNIDFSTIISLAKPRKYGASVNLELPMDTRDSKRGFFQDLKKPENQKCLYMYLEYLLSCIVRNDIYKYTILTIPEYFDQEDKTILYDICKMSKINVEGFMYNLTGTAACMAFKRKDLERFMVLDFGFQKCSAGIFEMREGELYPVYQRVLEIGASEFDDVLMCMIIEKYKFVDNNVTRERLQSMVYKFKKGFRDLEKVSERVLNDDYEYVNVEIEREEFIKKVNELTSRLEGFIEEVFNEVENKFKIPKIIEVVGNNSYFVIVGNIIEKYNYSTTLNASNSSVEGVCFAYSVNDRLENKHKVYEIVGNNITFKVEKEDTVKEDKSMDKSVNEDTVNEETVNEDTVNKDTVNKDTVNKDTVNKDTVNKDTVDINTETISNSEVKVFDKYSLQGNKVVVKYMRTKPFEITVLSDSIEYGKIYVNKEKTEKAELVKISVIINKYGLIEIKEVTIDNKPISYEFKNKYKLRSEELEEIIKENEEFKKYEEELEKFSKARCETQIFIDSYSEKYDRLFPGVLSEENKKNLTDLENNYFRFSSSNYEEEIEMRKNLLENMGFLKEKLEKSETIYRNRIKKNIEFIKPYVLSVCRKPRDMEFYGINKIFKDFEDKFYLTIENCIDMKLRFDNEFINAENKITKLIHEEELEKDELRKKEEEEELRKKEEEELKNKEEENETSNKEEELKNKEENETSNKEENETSNKEELKKKKETKTKKNVKK